MKHSVAAIHINVFVVEKMFSTNYNWALSVESSPHSPFSHRLIVNCIGWSGDQRKRKIKTQPNMAHIRFYISFSSLAFSLNRTLFGQSSNWLGIDSVTDSLIRLAPILSICRYCHCTCSAFYYLFYFFCFIISFCVRSSFPFLSSFHYISFKTIEKLTYHCNEFSNKQTSNRSPFELYALYYLNFDVCNKIYC